MLLKDKMVSPTVLSFTWESPYLGKTVLILRQGPGPYLKRMDKQLHPRADCGIKRYGLPISFQIFHFREMFTFYFPTGLLVFFVIAQSSEYASSQIGAAMLDS